MKNNKLKTLAERDGALVILEQANTFGGGNLQNY